MGRSYYLSVFIRRHSGMDCRNPAARDGKGFEHIRVFWIPAVHAGMMR
ncbi:MAG: hypothetical protein Q7T40_09390 [Methylobacter sp.]|nr:hypothetical protein [Methylobacter sp.]